MKKFKYQWELSGNKLEGLKDAENEDALRAHVEKLGGRLISVTQIQEVEVVVRKDPEPEPQKLCGDSREESKFAGFKLSLAEKIIIGAELIFSLYSVSHLMPVALTGLLAPLFMIVYPIFFFMSLLLFLPLALAGLAGMIALIFSFLGVYFPGSFKEEWIFKMILGLVIGIIGAVIITVMYVIQTPLLGPDLWRNWRQIILAPGLILIAIHHFFLWNRFELKK